MPRIDVSADEIWLTTVSIVIGTIISWHFFQKQKRPKTLDYAIEWLPVGVTGGMPAPSSLKILWEGAFPWEAQSVTKVGVEDHHVLTNPSIFRIEIVNTGKVAVDESDFKDPIKIRTSSGSIVDLEVIKVTHPNIYPLGPLHDATEQERRFRPVLLNPADRVTLQGVADQARLSDLTVEAWIKGQSRPMQPRRQIIETPLHTLLLERIRATAPAYNMAILLAFVALAVALFARPLESAWDRMLPQPSPSQSGR